MLGVNALEALHDATGKQGGAVVACLAHNQKVEGSKPSSAIVVESDCK